MLSRANSRFQCWPGGGEGASGRRPSRRNGQAVLVIEDDEEVEGEDAADNADDFSDSEYALGEFIDRYGPRLAHFNGVLQLFAQLGAPLPQPETPADG